jgi:hypothetical protein
MEANDCAACLLRFRDVPMTQICNLQYVCAAGGTDQNSVCTAGD